MRPPFDDEEVNLDLPLWRYFTLEYLVDSLESRTLHFPSVRQFSDPFEGAVAIQPDDWPVDPRYDPLEGAEGAFEELRRLTKVTSWHQADYESEAMWKLYAAEGKGVAIRTTAGRLEEGLKPFRLKPEYDEEEPYWGSVRYVDLMSRRLRTTMENRFFYKHRAFEWEREFRVIISLRSAEEFGVAVPEFGIKVPIDPQALIDSVLVGPLLEDDGETRLREACEQAGVRQDFNKSTLLGRPRYT